LPYIINELPLDEYVQATGETSDGTPPEYNKALLTAIRSYGYYHLSRSAAAPGKNMFDVSPTTADQLYLGYNGEASIPNLLVQTNATHGEMVTYNGNPVVTPYYSRSDGRTRSWKEVWGGDSYPWLQSVETVYDAGKTMLGHGVGMSGSDAIQRAKKEGWTYDQILKYYYTGVNVEKIY
jgi:stage II sporulation protein D